MRIERLAENKVKVTLTGDDLSGFDISVKKLSKNSTELHSFLFKIMETIREETGFNPYSGQIVIEAQSVGDGISITISKIEQNITKTIEKVRNGKRIRARVRESGADVCTYYFDSFDALCEAVINIAPSVHKTAALYKLDGQYCYIVDFDGALFKSGGLLCETISVLAEFSVRSSVLPMQHLHIKEHGRLIAEGDSLVSMYEGLLQISENKIN